MNLQQTEITRILTQKFNELILISGKYALDILVFYLYFGDFMMQYFSHVKRKWKNIE